MQKKPKTPMVTRCGPAVSLDPEEQDSSLGILYVVATPIGHRADMTVRAIDILKTVDLIAAEDTRHSRKLFEYYHIKTKAISLHAYNEQARTERLCQVLTAGKQVALVSDAGTPLMSDPGYYLVRAARALGIRIVPIPGPCAAIAAITASGLSAHRFVFEGFMPSSGAACRQRLLVLRTESRTIIVYEAVHRIVRLFEALSDVFESDREVVIARELTKRFETIHSGTVASLYDWLNTHTEQQKGEFVVVISGYVAQASTITDEQERILKLLLEELPLKQAVLLAAKITRVPKNTLYALALHIK